jgi:GNAT superfamily N-acetyltransferase
MVDIVRPETGERRCAIEQRGHPANEETAARREQALCGAGATIVQAEGAVLSRILDVRHRLWPEGLSRLALDRRDAAERKMAWSCDHQRRVALVQDGEWLASAKRYRLAGVLDERPVAICGIGSVFAEPMHRGHGHAWALVDALLTEARDEGADLALLFGHADSSWIRRPGFQAIPITEVELTVAQSPRHGAPMMLVRGGEERDLAAIAEMGRLRAAPFRFHLDRDVDAVRHAIARKRLRAGLAAPGAHQLAFFIAEEGITAAAYVVLSIAGDTWTLEECGDRDASGARVGALLQALIAREPRERRPSIRGWLPLGFSPPQISVVSADPSSCTLHVCALGPTTVREPLSGTDILFWHSDVL